MDEIMIKVYYTLVKMGSKTIDQVPQNLRAAVQLLLDKDAEKTTPTT